MVLTLWRRSARQMQCWSPSHRKTFATWCKETWARPVALQHNLLKSVKTIENHRVLKNIKKSSKSADNLRLSSPCYPWAPTYLALYLKILVKFHACTCIISVRAQSISPPDNHSQHFVASFNNGFT